MRQHVPNCKCVGSGRKVRFFACVVMASWTSDRVYVRPKEEEVYNHVDDLRRQLSEPPHFHLKKRERKTNLECDSIFPRVVSHVVLNCIVRKVHKTVWKWGSERRE